MLKLYKETAHGGNTNEYWDASWDALGDANLVDNDRVCASSPLLPLLERTLRPDRLFLEGGCGPGQWVKYFHVRGYKTLGIDFAERAVARLKAHDSTFDVRVGDVTRFDLPDRSVHSYYSGGVVEHFEEGPEAALREARRVLADDGCFLCSVPDDSTLRRALFGGHGERAVADYFVRRVEETKVTPMPPGRSFFQYEFTKDEFTRRLEAAGFEVTDTFGYSVLFGLMEAPIVGQLWSLAERLRTRGSTGARPTSSSEAQATPAGPPQSGSALRSLVRRVIFQEDRTLPVVGPAIDLLAEHASNMRMYVARPR